MKLAAVLFALTLTSSTINAGITTVALSDNGVHVECARTGRATIVLWADLQSSVIKFAILDELGHIRVDPADLISLGAAVAMPRVASDGVRFLVVWQTPEGAVVALFIDQFGHVSDGFTVIRSENDARVSMLREITWAGTRYLLNLAAGEATIGVWINPAGVVESTFRLPFLATINGHEDTVAAAWSKNLTDRSVVQFAELRDGVLSAGSTVATESFASVIATPFALPLSVGWNGNDYYLLWMQGQTARTVALDGAHISPDGAVSFAETLEGRYAMGTPESAQVHVAGDRYLATYLWGARIQAAWPSGSPTSTRRINLQDGADSVCAILLSSGELTFAYSQNRRVRIGLFASALRRAARH